MFNRMLILIIGFVLLSGCASNHMTKVSLEQETLKPKAGKALVHFMRPSNFGGAIQSTIYNGTDYIGTVSANTRVAYQADPGKYMFMVVGESADFMEAEVAADKTYFVNVSPRMGFWKARFSLNPVSGHESQSKIDAWFDETKEVVVNEKGIQWAKSKENEINRLKDKYLPKWQDKSDGDKQRLKAGSGI